MLVKDLSQELLLGTCIPINVVNSNLVIPHRWTSTIYFVVLQVVAKEDPRARTSLLLQHYRCCITVQFVNGISLKQLRSKLIFNSLEKTPLCIRAEFRINHLKNYRQPQYIYIVLSTCLGFTRTILHFFHKAYLLESMIS